jgi:hypothetical protein
MVRAAYASLTAEPGMLSARQLRIELDGLWKAIDAIAAGIDQDKSQPGVSPASGGGGRSIGVLGGPLILR